MKTITAITMQKKNKNRANVYLDNSYYCGLEVQTILENRLKVGNQISEEELDNIQLQSETQRAFDVSLNMLSLTMKTTKQIQKKLKEKGFVDAVINKVVEKLKYYGYVNDAEYSKLYVNSAKNKKGSKLIKLELKAKGVKEDNIEEALKDIESEFETAFKLGERYMRNKPKDLANKQKCYRHILSKGFDYDTTKEVVDKIFNDLEEN